MATDTAKVKATTATKAETFVGDQLARAERRIRLLDLSTALLGFLAGTFAYAVVMALLDQQWHLSAGLRQLSLLLYLGGAAFYLGWTVLRPLSHRINPYFAARQVEETLPGAKNSVINWLDLHEQKLAPAIRGAINNRAAKDLAKADIEKAISGLRTAIVGGLAGVLGGTVLILFLLFGPRQFTSLIQRAFAPFGFSVAPVTRTQLQILRPEEGNATVPTGRSVTILVYVDGRIPQPGKADAVKLHWRYNAGEPYQVRPLQPQESAREWSTVLSSAEVRDGFSYKVTGGDAETPEYQVNVRANPALTSFQATYKFRPYVGRVDEVRRRERTIEALSGTRVTLLVHTNRPLKSSQMQIETKNDKKTFAGTSVADDPQAFQVSFVIEETGLYRLSFVSTEDETYTDELLYPVVAQPDRAPEVELTKPGQDIRLPANGVLRLTGKASDDIGVQSLTVQMKAIGGAALRGKVYRADKNGLKLPSGGYPLTVEYQDYVDFKQVTSTEGKPYTLHPGMELEYWLEARDACDFPQPNVSQSKHYRVVIDVPQKDEKQQQQDRNQAQQEQKDHDAKENDQRNKEDQDRKNEKDRKEKEQKEQEDQAKKDAAAEKGGENNQDKKDDPGNADQKREDEKTRKVADQIQKEMDKEKKEKDKQDGKQEKGQPDKAEAKDDKPGGQSKDGGANQGQGQNDKGDKGEAKKDGPPDDKNKGGQQKEGGNDGAKDKPAAGKDGGKPEAKPDNKGEGKGGDPKGGQPQTQPGDGKEEGKDNKDGKQQANKPAEGKASAPKEGPKQAGEQKKSGTPGPQTKQPSDSKDGGKDGARDGQQAAGQNKGTPTGEQRSAGKDAGKDGPKGTEDKSLAKAGEKGKDAENPGAGKASPDKGDQKDLAKGSGKGDPSQNQPADANRKDLERLVKDLQSNDRDRREKAAEELEKIKEQAKDPQMKDIARKIQEELNKNPENQTAQAKAGRSGEDPMRPPIGDENTGKAKSGDPMATAGEPKAGKPGEGVQGPGTAKDGKDDGKNNNPMEGNPTDDGKGKADGKATAKAQGAPKAGQTPNLGGTDTSGRDKLDPNVPVTETPIRDDKANALSKRATEAQLEDFKKKLDKKLLERLKMTEEAREQFLKNYANLVKHDQSQTAKVDKPEVVPPPQQGTSLPSTGNQRPTVGGNASPNDTATTGQGQPPPGYREDYAEFNRMLLNKAPKK